MAGYSNKLCFILILLIHLVTSDQSLASTESQENVTTKDHKDGDPSSALFDRLFKLKRSEQKEAVKRIVEMKTAEKQNKLLEMVVKKIIEVLTQSRIKLESSGYVPGAEFPVDESIRDALSSMLENTAFMGDLVLYLPDAMKAFLKNNEWNIIFKWSLSLSRESSFLNKSTKKMLYLVAQELELVEREPNFFNPYAESNRKKTEPLAETTEKKKARKKIAKGPTLSGSKLKNEL